MTTSECDHTTLKWVKDDGGREAAGFKGHTGDCATRALSIALGALRGTEPPYREVYDMFHQGGNKLKAFGYENGKKSSARTGVPHALIHHVTVETLGWRWQSVSRNAHMTVEDLPVDTEPVFIADLRRSHWTAVIDGVIHDMWDTTSRYGGEHRRLRGQGDQANRLERVACVWLPPTDMDGVSK